MMRRRRKMDGFVVQIYEIETIGEAERLVEIGVEHIGSVIPYRDEWLSSAVLETVNRVKSANRQSSLIPLSGDREAVMRALDYYRPDIVHFCEAITLHGGSGERSGELETMIANQQAVRKSFPETRIMRSIPVPRSGDGHSPGHNLEAVLEVARALEPCSDIFMTDTVLRTGSPKSAEHQPVNGYVGITGETCDWDIAAALVSASGIPVILAGGISPENVFAAVVRVKPAGVDSCTKTNAVDAAGHPVRFRKDFQKVGNLVEEARRAAAALKR